MLLGDLEVIPPEGTQVPPGGSLAEDNSQGQPLPSLLPALGMAKLIQFAQEALGQRNAAAAAGVHRHEEGDSGAPPQTSLPRQEGAGPSPTADSHRLTGLFLWSPSQISQEQPTFLTWSSGS